MKRRLPSLLKGLYIAVLIAFLLFLSGCGDIEVLEPKGPVGETQKGLIEYAVFFLAGIIILVFVLFGIMLYKYRDKPNRKNGDYKPNLDGNNKLEFIWILVPVLIVTALSIPTVKILFTLEKPPTSESGESKEPLVVHATAADWKWIFTYEEEDIETVNYLHVPTDRPIEFRLSAADAMASLWIPKLGGQKYNMAGMETTLYLQADEEGKFRGRNASFTGEGFAGQTFQVQSESEQAFDEWVEETQDEAPELSEEEYIALLEPGFVDKKSYSSTHLDYVEHADSEGRDYALKRHLGKYGEKGYENNAKWREKIERDQEGE